MGARYITFFLRVTSLAGRFALSLFVIKYLEAGEAGQFALIYGGVLSLPAVFGFGLNYFVGRSVAIAKPSYAIKLVRWRIQSSIILGFLAAIFFVSFFIYFSQDKSGILTISPLMLLICFFEFISFDFYMMLIAQGRSGYANLLFFIRNASWIFPFILVGFIDSEYLSLRVLLQFWLLGILIQVCIFLWRDKMVFCIRPFSGRGAVDRFDLRKNLIIYLSDLGIVASMYFDRFIIASFVSLELVGAYNFYWSLINSAQVLLSVTLIQSRYKSINAAYKEGSDVGVSLTKKISLEIIVISFAAMAVFWVAAHNFFGVLDNGYITENVFLFDLLNASLLIKLLADVFGNALAAQRRDYSFATTNIISGGVALLSSYVGCKYFGLYGIGYGVIFSSLVALCIKIIFFVGYNRD